MRLTTSQPSVRLHSRKCESKRLTNPWASTVTCLTTLSATLTSSDRMALKSGLEGMRKKAIMAYCMRLSQYLPGTTENNYGNRSKDNQCPGRDSEHAISGHLLATTTSTGLLAYMQRSLSNKQDDSFSYE
jgi:hypothetical protein